MVTLIDDNLPVVSYAVIDPSFADEALKHRHVEATIPRPLGSTDLSDQLQLDSKEDGKLRSPLVQERLTMHKDQRAAATFRNEPGSYHGFSGARWGDQ